MKGCLSQFLLPDALCLAFNKKLKDMKKKKKKTNEHNLNKTHQEFLEDIVES